MRLGFLALLCATLIGCVAIEPNGNLAPYRSRLGEIVIDYALPSGARFTAGHPAETVILSRYEPYPLGGFIAAVGWSFERDIPQVVIGLSLLKISAPRFASSVAASEWESICRQERVSQIPSSRFRVVEDATGREWQEVTIESDGRLEARVFLRPIAPDTLILLRMNLRDRANVADRAKALAIQDRMLAAITITRLKVSSDALRNTTNPPPEANPVRSSDVVHP